MLERARTFRTSRTFDAVFLLVLVAGLWSAAVNRVAVGDWVYFLHYQPTSEVVRVADEAGLSAEGRRLLYRTNPQFAAKAEVEAVCDIEKLGCLTPRGQVYILDDNGQHAQAVVTAAHEMLHLAYRRLSNEQKAALAPLLDEAMRMNDGPQLEDELRDQTTTEDRRDEAHSLLGTEYKNLPPALEQYYRQYFADRAKVVAEERVSE